MMSEIPRYIAKNINVGLDFDGVLAHGFNAKVKYAKKRRKPVPKTDQVNTPVSPAVLRKMVERARREQGLSDEDVYG